MQWFFKSQQGQGQLEGRSAGHKSPRLSLCSCLFCLCFRQYWSSKFRSLFFPGQKSALHHINCKRRSFLGCLMDFQKSFCSGLRQKGDDFLFLSNWCLKMANNYFGSHRKNSMFTAKDYSSFRLYWYSLHIQQILLMISVVRIMTILYLVKW